MGTIALPEYLSRIEGLLEENRLAEAASNCHFIVQQYPRCVDAYRLLGKALLEQHLFDDSIDIFARVLSTDPEDLIAHAGLGFAYREKGDLSQALWHMKRAFELDPYNRVVQQELREIYRRRYHDSPARLELNRAALARLYFRSAKFDQAMAEVRRLLEVEPERVDLQLLLAEILYWVDQRVEASRLCLFIHEKYPDCIKANAILAETWLHAGRVAEAQVYLDRLEGFGFQDSDRYGEESVIGRAIQRGMLLSVKPRQVDVMDDINGQMVLMGSTEEDSWETGAAGATDTVDEMPEWLNELDYSENQRTVDVQPLSDDDDMFSWLQTVAAEEGDVFANDDLPAMDLSLDQSLSGVPASLGQQAEAEDLPTELEKTADLPVTPDNADFIEAVEPEGLPDLATEAEWLDEVNEEFDSTTVSPDWLYEQVGFSAESEEPADFFVPDWLKESAGFSEVDPGKPRTATPQGEELGFPDLDRVADVDSPVELDNQRERDAEQEAGLNDYLPEWLQVGSDELESSPQTLVRDMIDGSTGEPAIASEELPWLDEMDNDPDLFVESGVAQAIDTPADQSISEKKGGLPDWLKFNDDLLADSSSAVTLAGDLDSVPQDTGTFDGIADDSHTERKPPENNEDEPSEK